MFFSEVKVYISWLRNTNHLECCWQGQMRTKLFWLVKMPVITFIQQERIHLNQLDWLTNLDISLLIWHLKDSWAPGCCGFRASTSPGINTEMDCLGGKKMSSFPRAGGKMTERKTWVLCLWESRKLWKQRLGRTCIYRLHWVFIAVSGLLLLLSSSSSCAG